MSTADKIGLLPGFQWLANQSLFGDVLWSPLLSTLFMCWLLTPIGHVVVAYIAQATIIPLDEDRQFRSFFPGDLYLGTAIAILIFAASKSEKTGWWTSPYFHWAVLGFTLLVAFAITFLVDRKNMPRSALLSPSKLYHNFLLYGGYGYVAVVSTVAAVAGNWFSWWLALVALAVIVLIPWIRAVLDDGSLSPEETQYKLRHAHPARYMLFWIYPVRGWYDKE